MKLLHGKTLYASDLVYSGVAQLFFHVISAKVAQKNSIRLQKFKYFLYLA